MHLAPARRLKWPPFARLPASSFILQLSCSQLPAVCRLHCPVVLLSCHLRCPVLSCLAWLARLFQRIPTQPLSSFETFTVYFATAPSAPSILSPPLLLSSLLIHRLAIALARRFIWIIVMIYTEVAVATFGVQLRPDLARLGNELRRGLRV